jgi:hypothetical protein
MTFPRDPRHRVPRGDKNRRIEMGVDRDVMAATVGITTEQLHDYEFTQPDKHFDLDIARRVGAALERLEASQERYGNGVHVPR